MADDIVQVIQDAREDATSLSEFIYYPANTMVERRLAPSIHTLNYYLDYLHGLELIYSQPTGTVTVNGEEVKTIRQAINDSVDSVLIGEYQTQLEVKVNTNESNILELQDFNSTVPVIDGKVPSGAVSTGENTTQLDNNAVYDNFITTQEEKNTGYEEQKLDTGITATAKNGGIDRDLSEVLSETVSINNFATPDDAYAYAVANSVKLYVPDGEYAVTGDNIDYSVFYGNGLVNGAKISYLKNVERGQSLNIGHLKNVANASERYTLTRQGSGSGNVCQDFTVDNYKHELYTLHVVGTPEKAGINKFNSTRRTQTSTRYLKTTTGQIGHQGFGVLWDNAGARWFIAAAGEDFAEHGNKIVIFQISDDPNDATGLLITNLRAVQVHTNTASNNPTPCVSIGGRYLITKYYDGTTKAIVRTHDLRKIVNNPTVLDFSADYLSQFEYYSDFSIYPLQSIACDNEIIYIFSGYGVETGYPLIATCFDMLGTKLYQDTFAVGQTKALTDGTKCEVEGTDWTYIADRPVLSVIIASGELGARKTRVWQLCGDTSIVGVVASGSSRPAFISEADNDFAAPYDEALRIGHYNSSTGAFELGMRIGTDQKVTYSDKNSGSLTVRVGDGTNLSSTTGTGSFVRVGNLIFVNISFANISTTGLSPTANLTITMSAAADKNFSAVPTSNTPLNFTANDYILAPDVFQTDGMLYTDGKILIREGRSNAVFLNADVNQFNVADIQLSGCYIVA